MNRPSYSASSASWRLVTGSTSIESFSAMRAMYLIEAGDDGAIFSLGSYSTARSYFAIVRALGSRHSRLVWRGGAPRREVASPLGGGGVFCGRVGPVVRPGPGA